jgi:REP element-mobilizing transposase RayT
MPNHFHLMIRIRSLVELSDYARLKKKDAEAVIEHPSAFVSQQFSNLLNSYSKSFNNRYERIGSLFQPNVRRKEIVNDDYFARLIAYIHHNPVHHCFCRNILEWSYSSIHAYVSDKSTKIDKRYLMDWVGNEAGLVRFHKELAGMDLAEFNLGGSW